MQRQPVQFHLADVPHATAIELAARRRMRGMEASYPAVLEWDLRVEVLVHADADDRFAATTRARIVGGDMLNGEARASDALRALRLAFERLEAELESEHEHARSRAAEWLTTVKRRLAHRVEAD